MWKTSKKTVLSEIVEEDKGLCAKIDDKRIAYSTNVARLLKSII